MTLIATLPMTKDNLEIHLSRSEDNIITGRDEIKGHPGQIYRIEGTDKLWVLAEVSRVGLKISDYAREYFRDEGYLDTPLYDGNPTRAMGALKHVLTKTYGDYNYVRIFRHKFLALDLTEEDLK